MRLLEEHRARINHDLQELETALELVDRKIAGYDVLLRRGLKGESPDHRPSPRKVRVRAAD